MSQKKPSLFKQRIKDSKVQTKQGFPQVIKITTEKKEAPYKPIIDSMKQKHIIQQDQYDEISKQNNDFISKLSLDQIEKMQRQLRQELPADFMLKLRKAMDDTKPAQTQTTPLEQANMQCPPVSSKHSTEYKKLVCQQMDRLSIDPATKDLFLKKEEEPQAICLSVISLMIDSQNNQSFITGLKTLSQFLCSLNKYTFVYGITIIDSHYFSQRVLLQHIYQCILSVAMSKEDMKVFKTCNVQLIQTLLKFKAVGGCLPDLIYKNIVKEAGTLQGVADLADEVKQSNRQMVSVSLWTKLLSEGKLQTLQQLVLVINTPTVLLQKLSIEYCYYGRHAGQLSDMVHYYDDLLSRLVTYRQQHLNECQNALELAYKVFQACAISSEVQQFPSDLPQYLSNKMSPFLIAMLQSADTLQTYKILFILSRYSIQSFNQVCQKMNKHPQCLCFINLELYLNVPWKEDDTILMTQMLKMVQMWDGDISFELVLLHLLKMFECSCENYQQLDMDSVFRKVIWKCRSNVLKKVVSLATVKTLVRYYNSNSFGNIVFSKVMALLGSSIFDESVQLHIINECFERYPYIFYEAGKEKMYAVEGHQVYEKSGRSGVVLQELETVKKMLADKMEEVMHNDFLKQL